MDYISIIISIVAGLSIGLIIVSRKNIDHTRLHKLNNKDFAENMRKGQLIDIRNKEDYSRDKIKGARNFRKRSLTSKNVKLRKDLSVYIYCNNGKKSYRVAKKLAKNGFIAIYILEKGFINYK